jgi:hypothetical protein
MINIITPPSLGNNTQPAIFLVCPAPADLELVLVAARRMSIDIDIYLCGDDTAPLWFRNAVDNSQRLFRQHDIHTVYEYLNTIDTQTTSTLSQSSV